MNEPTVASQRWVSSSEDLEKLQTFLKKYSLGKISQRFDGNGRLLTYEVTLDTETFCFRDEASARKAEKIVTEEIKRRREANRSE